MSLFYELHQVPVHSVLLLMTREQARNYPKGDITLGFCHTCGFISNVAFFPEVHEYSAKYESTQTYSPTFNAFHHRLASSLLERYDLHGKEIIEIGCGQGEFLTLLCELGQNRGIGFDPAYDPSRGAKQLDGVTFISDFYSEKYVDYRADFVCCKMTLEHIHATAEFVATVRRSVGDQPDTIVFFQVPNARYVFSDVAFWDVYYEHCSYFSLGSIARLFRRNHFDVMDLWMDYDDQYLMIEARPRKSVAKTPMPQENDLFQLEHDVANFAAQFPKKLGGWRRLIRRKRAAGRKIVLWGGGSKGVAFLTTLDLGLDDVPYAVDINPNKSGTFMAGTCQEIVSPSFLQTFKPDDVIIMNPIYRHEIQRDLEAMGLTPNLMTVEHI
jgi:2-polyprenyl-3-methyl-5-hydroxy-6-metoxy-1,4-benzoquinol methylase